MTEQEKIEFYSDRQQVQCACDECKQMCKTMSCLPTPSEALAIVDHGFLDKLQPVNWNAGAKHGFPMTELYMPKFDAEKGCCVFFTDDGLCQLHDLGLKPTEGRLANCKSESVPADKFPLAYVVAGTWRSPENVYSIAMIDLAYMDLL